MADSLPVEQVSKSWLRALAATTMLVLAAGCGNKGPLYLPNPEPHPASSEAAADDDDEPAREEDTP